MHPSVADETSKQIRQMIEDGTPCQEIANRFGISVSRVSQIGRELEEDEEDE